jgi:ATP-binding cassette subfamily B protein
MTPLDSARDALSHSHPLGARRLVRGCWLPLTAALIAMVVESAAGLWEPWPLKVIFDSVITGRPVSSAVARWSPFGTAPLDLLNTAVAALVAIAVIGALASYAEKYLSTLVGQRVVHDLRCAVYAHVQRLSLPFFETRRTGDLVVRMTSDVDTVQDFVSSSLLGMLVDLLTLVGMLAIMLYLDWRFTLLSLAVAPLLFAAVYRRTHRIKAAAREVKKRESELASLVQESFAAVRTVRTFAREDYEQGRLERKSRESVDAALRARGIKAALPLLVDVLVAVGTASVLLVGVRRVLAGDLTSGTLLVFVLYLGKLYKPMRNLSKAGDTISKTAVALERIAELLQTDRQVIEPPDAVAAPRFHGRIELRDVHFRYAPDQQPVLRGINLRIEPGARIAIVGATGAGKSTLLSLLLRLRDPLAGMVLFDGRDARQFTRKSLRDQISVVPQEPVLFHGSVWQNIAYGRPDATADEIMTAATLANADEFITRMPDGYDTIIGERGETLSGGQRQRIAIARAVIRKAPILLLDEPSAALDPESEALVFDALSRLMRGCTSITIAHRMATVRRAHQIYLLDDGLISAFGTHEQLLAHNASYAQRCRLEQPDGELELAGSAAS